MVFATAGPSDVTLGSEAGPVLVTLLYHVHVPSGGGGGGFGPLSHTDDSPPVGGSPVVQMMELHRP